MKKRTPHKHFYKKDFRVEQDAFLLEYLMSIYSEKSRSEVKSYLVHRQILVNNVCQTQYNFALKKGDTVTFMSIGHDTARTNNKCKIIFEDDAIIIVNKSHGLLAMSRDKGEDNVIDSIRRYLIKREHNDEVELYLVNRLERDVSGLMILAKDKDIQRYLRDAWNENRVRRLYIAVAEGVFTKDRGEIVSYLTENKKNMRMNSSQEDNGGKKATTRYKVLRQGEHYTLLELDTVSEYKSQIRVQLSAIRHPVAGDKKYGASSNPIKRVALHLSFVSFSHPVTGNKVEFKIDIPKEFV